MKKENFALQEQVNKQALNNFQADHKELFSLVFCG
jgi:hypothetical protein